MTEQDERQAHNTVAAGAVLHASAEKGHQPPSHWRVFAEAGTAGNLACVYLSSQPVSAADRRALAAAQPDTTHCFSWLEASIAQSYRVHCHNGQTEIQRCGHGFLAVGGALFATGITKPVTLLAADDIPITVTKAGDEMTGREATTGSAQGATSPVLEIHLPRVHCRKNRLPDWVDEAFEPAPVAAATAGDADGYWVFEWGADCDLTKLAFDSAAICRNSQRAVIATRSGSADSEEFDFLLRYFAPQYGVVEDSVTGSANAVLADYWAGCSGLGRFRARQCSAAGGVVYSRLTASGVVIGGEVQRL